MHLTTLGEEILPYARLLIEDHERLQNRINDIHGIRTGCIRIGTFSSVAIHWLPDIFAEFQKRYPLIDYEMLLGDYDEVERWIEEGRVDCGFLRLPTKLPFDTISLKMDEYMAVLPKGHPLSKQKKIRVEQLNDQPFILLEHGGKTEVSDFLEKSGVHPNIRFTTWEDYAIMAMVEKGLGIGILPGMILQRIPYDIEIRPFEKPYFREIGMAVKDKNRMSPVTEKFTEYLKIKAFLP